MKAGFCLHESENSGHSRLVAKEWFLPGGRRAIRAAAPLGHGGDGRCRVVQPSGGALTTQK